MSKEHEITLLTFYQQDDELNGLHYIEPYCKKVITVKKRPALSIVHMMVMGLFTRLPFQVLYYRSKKFKNKLAELLNAEAFDLLHVYMLRIAAYGSDTGIPKVLDLIDSMQLNFQRRVETQSWPLKWLFRIELKRVTRFEHKMISHYDRSITVSDTDRNTMASDRVETIPLGIDTEVFYPSHTATTGKPVIAFTGNMGYYPNRQAIIWFLDHCWNKITHAVPGVCLIIAGKDPGPALNAFDDGNSVKVLGYVESIADILRQATLAIAPMQSGSGMQFKILEAMACAVPVVATRLGLGSIPAVDKESIFLADEPDTFAKSCIELLKDPAGAAESGAKGLELVQDQFTWDANVDKLNRIYHDVIENHTGISK